MARTCAQCGGVTELRHGRCGECGGAADLGAVLRYERRAAILRVIGDEWYWWIVEITALVLVALVVAGAAPAWTLGVVGVFLIRAVSRLAMLLVRGVLEQPV